MSKTICAFDGAEIESDKFEAAQSKGLEMKEVQAWAYGTHTFLSDTPQFTLQVGLLVACWAVEKSGGMAASELTTFMFCTGFVLESSNEVRDQWAKIQQAVGGSISVFDLIQGTPAMQQQQQHCLPVSIQSPIVVSSMEYSAHDITSKTEKSL